MPSIAQQDYNVIQVADLESLTDTEKKAIIDAHEHHILFDTIIVTKESEESHEMRILSFKESAAALTIALFSLISSEITTISLELV